MCTEEVAIAAFASRGYHVTLHHFRSFQSPNDSESNQKFRWTRSVLLADAKQQQQQQQQQQLPRTTDEPAAAASSPAAAAAAAIELSLLRLPDNVS